MLVLLHKNLFYVSVFIYFVSMKMKKKQTKNIKLTNKQNLSTLQKLLKSNLSFDAKENISVSFLKPKGKTI